MPALFDWATHLSPFGLHAPDQMNCVGELVQVAVMVTRSPVFGAAMSALSVHTGTGPDGGGGVVPPVQVIGRLTCGPVPLALTPDTAKLIVVAVGEV